MRKPLRAAPSRPEREVLPAGLSSQVAHAARKASVLGELGNTLERALALVRRLRDDRAG